MQKLRNCRIVSAKGRSAFGGKLLNCFIILVFFCLIANAVTAEPSLAETETAAAEAGWILISEPNIRVGLYKTDQPVEFVSDFDYEINVGGENHEVIWARVAAKLSYQKGIYSVKTKTLFITSTHHIRLEPIGSDAFFVLKNYQRLVQGRGKEGFNAYRGTLEYQFSPKSKLPYIINELPLDSYVAGIAEVGGSENMEYIKAILIAARSYAYYNIQQSTAADMFNVYASTVDQLYLGYNSEKKLARVAQAAAVTYGRMVTYQGNPVTAPYFSRSSGATLSSVKVWGGSNKPWLVPVKCIYDKGKKQLGHGAGMSTTDALAHAKKDGWTAEEILQYYYTETQVERVY